MIKLHLKITASCGAYMEITIRRRVALTWSNGKRRPAALAWGNGKRRRQALVWSNGLIKKYVADKYFSKMFNHHIDMTAYKNFIALSTNFPDSPRMCIVKTLKNLLIKNPKS
jgi:hypothetical protein